MCRLLGVVCSETTDFRFSLRDAPRSLAALSTEHAHGWGLAVHGSDGWNLHRNPVRAGDCDRFHSLAATERGELMVAHIRQRTVGPIDVTNTHPFRQDRWVFAHNGTIEDIAWFEERTAERRRAEVMGQTDSERFFAWLLTELDRVSDRAAVDATLLRCTEQALSRPRLGAANFLLSDGQALYAFRAGRSLFVLERHPGDPVRLERAARETGAALATPWSKRRHAVLVASEAMTDEPWRELAQHALVRIDWSGPSADGGQAPAVTVLRG